MKHKIGFFVNESAENEGLKPLCDPQQKVTKARKSLVRVFFFDRQITLSYYNDLFDLKVGDIVFVDGKLENHRGRVVDVSYSFKIKISDYKRVISVADTDVRGKLSMSRDCFISFEKEVLPKEKVNTWFFPKNSDEEYMQGYDESEFPLDDLHQMNVSSEIAQRGFDYYRTNKVVYLTLEDNKGYAIVEGSEFYQVEFEYNKGMIKNLTCSCFCSFNCKHEFAVMLQLRDCLNFIKENHLQEFESKRYFSAVIKGTFFDYVMCENCGSFVLG